LELTVKAASLHLIEEKNIGERQAIESALREEVLETAKYPEISFKSRRVTAERRGDGTYDEGISAFVPKPFKGADLVRCRERVCH
jgi:polyisoprenoid-binding protein YceI